MHSFALHSNLNFQFEFENTIDHCEVQSSPVNNRQSTSNQGVLLVRIQVDKCAFDFIRNVDLVRLQDGPVPLLNPGPSSVDFVPDFIHVDGANSDSHERSVMQIDPKICVMCTVYCVIQTYGSASLKSGIVWSLESGV